ncbi:MAG: carboxymuconolactone decarboxylase family protein [Blastomonas sp.]|nr:carboxymuconolactone decarboxylase family protein [Blastomonas sp.]
MSRIEPLKAPYAPEFDAQMKVLMRGADPLVLFRTLAKHDRAWRKFGGGSLLDKHSPLPLRQREVVINRVTAKCGCEYEWGVHVAGFAEHAGLSVEQIFATVHGDSNDPAWPSEEQVLIATVDALLDRKKLTEPEWLALRDVYDEPQCLEVIQLVAFYHGVALICGALDLPLETNAARFPAA